MIKTAELKGKVLDWALAVALGRNPKYKHGQVWVSAVASLPDSGVSAFDHSNPALCLGLIEQYKIDVTYEYRHKDCPMWIARMPRWGLNCGSTVAEAIARCVVAMQLGDEVEVPDELVKP